jgi:predicted AlkP superfamily pyrophosphatase or phosphodiesterase
MIEKKIGLVATVSVLLLAAIPSAATAQTPPAAKAPVRSAALPTKPLTRPKLVVVLVVDQMRGDYVDKFRGQWSGGLKRLLDEGAWFRNAAYPYAATETCVGHSTISTGAFPATHGMVSNSWFDRESQKPVTCTADPKAKNLGYAGISPKTGDSAWRMQLPAFAEELKFQTNGATRIATFSLKARVSITLAGHKADAVTWFEDGGWVTSDVYGTAPFLESYIKAHPIRADYGKTWALSLPASAYWYDEKAVGAAPPQGWDLTFPHSLRGTSGASEPDAAFYTQWATSPYADAYLTHLAETTVDSLGLGEGGGTDFLGIGYSTLDYAGHAFGPRSREVQDILVRLDKDVAELLAFLDKKVGRGNYVVALSADHGVVPIPEDMQRTGADAGVLRLAELQERMEKALEPFHMGNPAVARIGGLDVYFAPGVYDKLKQDPKAMDAVLSAALSQPGVANVFRAEQVQDRPATQNPLLNAFASGYFPGRSGDLFIAPKPYWLADGTPVGKTRAGGTSHEAPYLFDQHVPIILAGFGIQRGEFFREVTPADIAPTLAALCGVSLAARDGHVLTEALAHSTSTASAAH